MTINYLVLFADLMIGLVLASGVGLLMFGEFGLGVACLLAGSYSLHLNTSYKKDLVAVKND